MKRFTGWRSSAAEDDGQQASPPEHSPTRSQLSNNSTSSRGASSSLRSAYAAPKSREQSPARFGAASADTLGAATGSSGGAVVAVSSKKMLKIGANVRFRGDVMECNTVVLCGRLQGFVETQRMTIREGGMFIGDAKVEEADVYGSLDGSLESTAKVSIRSTGSVSGNVIYKKITMEDGGELEGTFECSNRAGGRLRNREGSATGGVGGLRRGSRDDSGALAVRDNQNTISPPGKQSPILWQNGQGAAYAGGAAAAAAAAGEEAWAGGGRVGAALDRAGGGGGTGAGGSGSGPVMSSVARLEASPRGKPVTPGGTAAATTPVGVGTGGGLLRRITPTGAGLSTAVRAPSPLRSTRGLQVQGLGAEAGELFSEEAVTPVGESGAGVTDLPSARSRRSSATTGGGGGGGGGGDGSAEEEGTSGGGGGGTSVAARVGTWPPPSPVPSSTRLWQKRTENHTTPAPTPSPAAPSTTAAPPAQTSGSITQNTVKSLVESYKPPHLQGTSTASQRQQQEQPGSGSAASRTLVSPSVVDLSGSGPVGNGDGVTGGGAGVGRMGIAAEEKLDNYESALEEESDSDSAPKISGPVKACEVDGCNLEACWGDPRFRPRYCARHKKQGNKLMSPVEAEEGDTSAASPESSPPMEALPSPAKPLTDLKLGARGLPSVQPVDPPNGSGGGGGGHSTESDGLESDEDEDEGWDSGGGAAVVAAVGGRLVAAANGGSNLGGASGGSGGGFSGGGGRGGGGGGGGGGGFGVQPALPVVQAELVGNGDDHRHQNPDPEGYDEPGPVGYGGYGAAGGGGGGGGAADAEAEDADDVQARVAAYTRLAGKKQPQTTAHVPSLPKPKAQKPKKRASATNIADFYGGGESDDDEVETTGFNMDAYNKGVLLNQAAEVGTHTEDGQLRPQASSERDQQKLAHLMRVGKLGAALRGKGVTSGKRR